MKVVKRSNFYNGDMADYAAAVDDDLRNIVLCLTGRVSFGTGTGRGQNISGEFASFTSHATPDTEFSVTHTLGVVPIGVLITGQDKAGSLYQLSGTGTAWTSTTLYFKCDVASVTFNVFLLKGTV